MLFRVLTAAVLMLSLLTACASPRDTVGGGSGSQQQNTQAAKSTAPAQSNAASAQSTQRISEEEATAIALAHAGFASDEVTGLRIELDFDDGRPEYDIHFRQGQWEYDYDIHAETGKILSYEKDN